MSKRRPTPRKQVNRLWMGIALAVVAVLVIAFVVVQLFNRSQTVTDATDFPAEVSVSEAVNLRNEGAFILDVRQPEEWAEYHVPDSTLIPLDELNNRISEVPRNQKIVVVCRSGNRSQQGRDILLNAGFTQVASMAGGLSGWRSEGHPVEEG